MARSTSNTPKASSSLPEEAFNQFRREWEKARGTPLAPEMASAISRRFLGLLRGDVEVPEGSLARGNIDTLINRLKKSDPATREYSYGRFDPRTPRGVEPSSQQKEELEPGSHHELDIDPDISLSR